MSGEQAKGEASGLRLTLTLAFAGLLSGTAIVGAYELTLPQITENKARALEKAVLEVVPGAVSTHGLVAEGGRLRDAKKGETGVSLYGAYGADGKLAGYAIAAKGPGFQDTIELIYGYAPDRRHITGMVVLESRETPGLGDKITKDEHFLAEFHDLAVDPEVLVVKAGQKTGGQTDNQVDAITGATISSKAVVKIINTADAAWLDKLGGKQGASPKSGSTP